MGKDSRHIQEQILLLLSGREGEVLFQDSKATSFVFIAHLNTDQTMPKLTKKAGLKDKGSDSMKQYIPSNRQHELKQSPA